jgi:diguanylate cyclase (GGDEF)-like protein
MKLLENILRNDYIYNLVRLQGGAYICDIEFIEDKLTLLSFSDADVWKTLAIFEAIPDWVENANITQEDVNRQIEVMTYRRGLSKTSVDNIMNKAIHHISDSEINEIIERELLMNPYPIEIADFWYQYWEWIVFITFIVAVVLVMYALLTNRIANYKVEKKEYELLQKKIQLDEITGLYNRTYFFELARELIDKTREEMCIVTMDVSNFKVVNELYGMNAGDKLLKELAEQLLDIGKKYEMILARFMADHYYMCMSKKDFERIDFPKSFKTFLEDMDIKVVYGVFIVEDGNSMPVNVMCDRAFAAAHDKTYKYVEYIHFYNDLEHKQIMAEQEIENEMEKALEERQFYIVVQPKYNSVSEKVVGGEALVRWQHPKKGMISPGVFIPVFEKNGFIIHLDY